MKVGEDTPILPRMVVLVSILIIEKVKNKYIPNCYSWVKFIGKGSFTFGSNHMSYK